MLNDASDLGLIIPHVPTEEARQILRDFPCCAVVQTEGYALFSWYAPLPNGSTYNKWELWWQLSDGSLLYEFLRVKEKRVTYSNKVSVSLFRERLDSSTGDVVKLNKNPGTVERILQQLEGGTS